MITNFSAKTIDNATCGKLRDEGAGRFRFFIMAALLAIAALGLGGCAGGYGPGYYAPDYGSYYSDYGYDGNPYWGSGQYSGGDIVVDGVHHHGHFGGHHFVHESNGPRASVRSMSPARAPSTMRSGGRR